MGTPVLQGVVLMTAYFEEVREVDLYYRLSRSADQVGGKVDIGVMV